MTTGTYLDKIIPRTKLDLDSRRALVSQDELINKIQDIPSTIDFYQAFKKDKLHLIAEIKKASPSKGIFDANLDVEADEKNLVTLLENQTSDKNSFMGKKKLENDDECIELTIAPGSAIVPAVPWLEEAKTGNFEDWY